MAQGLPMVLIRSMGYYHRSGGDLVVTRESIKAEDESPIELKDPALAAFLAWLVPGLGHFYQKRTGKAILFFVCIMSTFYYGLYLGEGRVVYASWREGDKRLPYLCQMGAGLPAMPALVQASRVRSGKGPLWGGFMSPPKDEPTLDALHYKLHRFFELGTVYTMVAGLLNILAIYDAWGGPVFTEESRDTEDEDQEEKEPAEAKS